MKMKKCNLPSEIPCARLGCGKLFTPHQARQRFCSPECSHANHREKAVLYQADVRAGRRVETPRVRPHIKAEYKCPYCGTRHHSPHDSNPDVWQACRQCHGDILKNGYPVDEYEEVYRVSGDILQVEEYNRS